MKQNQEANHKPKWAIWMRPRNFTDPQKPTMYVFKTKKDRDLTFKELVEANENNEMEILKNTTAIPNLYEKKKK
jgi:hypothetical protein